MGILFNHTQIEIIQRRHSTLLDDQRIYNYKQMNFELCSFKVMNLNHSCRTQYTINLSIWKTNKQKNCNIISMRQFVN